MQAIISPADLLLLRGSADFVLVDARVGPNIHEKYAQAHLDGAVFADLETDLAHKNASAAEGGRHPLPSVAAFCRFLGQIGIGPDTRVVVYDDKNGSNAAARFWWMLHALGHAPVQVLDGGYDAALAAGFPANDQVVSPQNRGEYQPKIDHWQTASIEQTARLAGAPEGLVIDVRSNERYRGLVEPIDKIAGHIPGAKNIPFTENLDSQGFFLSPDALRSKYAPWLAGRSPEKTIVHCGSGVTACHTLLALAAADFPLPQLYVGSWSEWSNQGRAIGTDLA